MRLVVDASTLVLAVLAVVLSVVAYVKDPGLPFLGARSGGGGRGGAALAPPDVD